MAVIRDKINIFHVPTGEAVVLEGLVTSFEDKWSPKWNSEEVYGRMDPIMTFQATPRTIAITIDMIGNTKSNATRNWNAAQRLVQFMYPTYDSPTPGVGSLAAAPLLKVKWGAQITNSTDPARGLLCACTDISLGNTFGISDQNIGYRSGETLTPQRFQINMSFTVLHTGHKVGWSRDDKASARIQGQTGKKGGGNVFGANRGYPYTLSKLDPSDAGVPGGNTTPGAPNTKDSNGKAAATAGNRLLSPGKKK
tara:strand:+ start:14428 stop:15183 length:756 start_codon:yes stop_codon:yes gene_type:complete